MNRYSITRTVGVMLIDWSRWLVLFIGVAITFVSLGCAIISASILVNRKLKVRRWARRDEQLFPMPGEIWIENDQLLMLVIERSAAGFTFRHDLLSPWSGFISWSDFANRREKNRWYRSGSWADPHKGPPHVPRRH